MAGAGASAHGSVTVCYGAVIPTLSRYAQGLLVSLLAIALIALRRRGGTERMG